MRRISRMASTLALALFVIVPGAVLADTVELPATKDNTLFEEDEKKSNGIGDYIFAGNTDSAETRRAVIAFDVSSIPAGSTINSVTLTLYMSRTQAGNVTVNLHRLLADWGEGDSDAGGQEGGGEGAQLNDATWRYTFYDPDDEPGSPQWSTRGGDFVSGPSAGTTVGGNGSYDWTGGALAIDVQGWVDGTSANYGWIVRGGESGNKLAKRFNSRHGNDANRHPKLTVDFTPPAGACCLTGGCQELTPEDCSAQGGTFQGSGTSCTPDPCVDPTGACCIGDGSCSELSASSCSTQSGTYQGDGTTCTPNPCPQPTGACCSDTAPWGCTEVTETDCTASGGTYQGNDTLCGATECPVILEAYVDALPIPAAAQPVSGSAGGTATYHVVMQEFQQNLHRDLPDTTVWGYGDAPDPFDPATTYATFPGPSIEARTGFPVTIRYFNQLRDTSQGGSPPPLRTSHYLPIDNCPHGAGDPTDPVRTVVHLHGGHVEQQFDGYPEATFLPGEEAAVCVTDPEIHCTVDAQCPAPGQCDGNGASCTSDTDCVGQGGNENCELCEPGYRYPNLQDASTLWFHDHALGITRLNVYMGMASAYIIRDDVEDGLGLPAGEFEVPLIIQDRSFNADGTWKYPDQWVESFFGNKALVNGKVWPFLNVKQGKYRFRVLNGSNSRRYVLTLDRSDLPGPQDVSFDVIGADGGLLEAPVTLSEIVLGPAERADIVVDFQAIPVGTEIVIANSAVVPGQPEIPEIMKFIVIDQPGDTGAIPTSLRTVETLDPNDAVRTREFLLRKGDEPCTGQAWFIKSRNESGVEVGQLWDDLTEFPQLGTTEIWEFVNPTVVPHPMHMHLDFFQILNRQDFEIVGDEIIPLGQPEPPAPEEAGWKDTARAEPGKILRVITRFEDYIGKYSYHCHILEHEDHEMMRQFQTVEPSTVSMDAADINWDSVPGATGYDVIRGDLNALRGSNGDFTDPGVNITCKVAGLLVNSTPHAGDNPPVGDGYWYLNRFRDAIGKGSYDTGYSSQSGRRDDEITASGNDCP